MEGPPASADPDGGNGQRSREGLELALLIAFVDTSAFIKVLIDEPGSADAHDAWDAADRRVSARVLYVEARSALARAARSRLVRPGQYADARSRLESLWDAIDPVEVDDVVVAHAGDLAEQHALRAYDAVHLACAEAVADDETVLVSADRKLVAVARERGLATLALV